MFIEKVINLKKGEFEDFLLREISSDIDKRNIFWVEIDKFFEENNTDVLNKKIFDNFNTLWRYYVVEGWNMLYFLKKQKIANFISMTYVDAILFGVYIMDDYLNYLAVECVDQNERIDFFIDTKNNLSNRVKGMLSSQWSIVYEQILIYINDNADSLRKAEILSDIIKKIDKAKLETDQDVFENSETVLDFLISFISFFHKIEPDNLQTVLLLYIEPDVISAMTGGVSVGGQEPLSVQSVIGVINMKFPKTPTGEYEDIDGVMAELDRLANQTGDDSIRDLYYFNESTGKFEWKE